VGHIGSAFPYGARLPGSATLSLGRSENIAAWSSVPSVSRRHPAHSGLRQGWDSTYSRAPTASFDRCAGRGSPSPPRCKRLTCFAERNSSGIERGDRGRRLPGAGWAKLADRLRHLQSCCVRVVRSVLMRPTSRLSLAPLRPPVADPASRRDLSITCLTLFALSAPHPSLRDGTPAGHHENEYRSVAIRYDGDTITLRRWFQPAPCTAADIAHQRGRPLWPAIADPAAQRSRLCHIAGAVGRFAGPEKSVSHRLACAASLIGASS